MSQKSRPAKNRSTLLAAVVVILPSLRRTPESRLLEALRKRFCLTSNGFSSIRLHMLTYPADELERFAEIFKALSNPNRLAIFLRLISQCPPGTSCAYDPEIRECVGDVGKDLGISRTTVSHHVKELRRAGLLRVERRGRNIECLVDGETVLFLADLLTGRLGPDTNSGKISCETGRRK